MDLYRKGMIISNIAKEVGISRHSVYNVIHDDIEKDADIHKLKKMLRKAEMHKRLRDLSPSTDASLYRGSALEQAIDDLSSKVQAMWHLNSNPDIREHPQYCVYCGEELRYGRITTERGVKVPAFKCQRCDKVFPFP